MKHIIKLNPPMYSYLVFKMWLLGNLTLGIGGLHSVLLLLLFWRLEWSHSVLFRGSSFPPQR